jgi:hypothetical protein
MAGGSGGGNDHIGRRRRTIDATTSLEGGNHEEDRDPGRRGRAWPVRRRAATAHAAEPAAEGIMKYAINKPSTAWNVYGPGQTNAPVKDKAVIGGGGIRVQVTAPTPDKPWTSSAGQAVGGKIAKGDIITIAFWAKAEPVDGGPATANITSVRSSRRPSPGAASSRARSR